jgi:hypothetical protein
MANGNVLEVLIPVLGDVCDSFSSTASQAQMETPSVLMPFLVSATELACRVLHRVSSNDAMMSAKPARSWISLSASGATWSQHG